jgi:hypothetical protein
MNPQFGNSQPTPRFHKTLAATRNEIHDLELERIEDEIAEFQQSNACSSPVCRELRNTLNALAPSLDFSGWQDDAEIRAMLAVPPKLIESIVAYRSARFTAAQWKISWPAREKFALPEWFASVPDWLSMLDMKGNIVPFDAGGNGDAEHFNLWWDARAGNIFSELKMPAQKAIIDFYNTKLGTSIRLPRDENDDPVPIGEIKAHLDELLAELSGRGDRSELRLSFAVDNGNHSVPLTYVRSPQLTCWMIFDSFGTLAMPRTGMPSYHTRMLKDLARLRDKSKSAIYLVTEKSQIGHGCRTHTIAVGKALTQIEADGSYRIPMEQLLQNAKPVDGWENFFAMDLPAELLVLAQTSKFIEAHRGATAETPVRRRNSGRRPADLNLAEFFSRHQNPITKHRDYLRRKGLRTTLLARMNHYARSLQEHGTLWSDALTRAFYRQAKACLRAAEASHQSSLGQDADAYNLMRSALALDDWLAQHDIIPSSISKEIAPDSIEWKSMLERSFVNCASKREQQLTFDLGMKTVDVLSPKQIRMLFLLGTRVASSSELNSLAELISWDTDPLSHWPVDILSAPLCAAIGPILRITRVASPSLCGGLLLMATAEGQKETISTVFQMISKLSPADQVIALCVRNEEHKTVLALALTGQIGTATASEIIAGVGLVARDPSALAEILTVALTGNSISYQALDKFNDLLKTAKNLLRGDQKPEEYKTMWTQLKSTVWSASKHATTLKTAVNALAQNTRQSDHEEFYVASIGEALSNNNLDEAEMLFDDMTRFPKRTVEALWKFEADSRDKNLLAMALHRDAEFASRVAKHFLDADFSPLIKASIFERANGVVVNSKQRRKVSEIIDRLRMELTNSIRSDDTLSLADRERALSHLQA